MSRTASRADSLSSGRSAAPAVWTSTRVSIGAVCRRRTCLGRRTDRVSRRRTHLRSLFHRAYGPRASRQPRALLSMIHVARAFTCHQLERLLSDCLMAALERYQCQSPALRTLRYFLRPGSTGTRSNASLWPYDGCEPQIGPTRFHISFFRPQAPMLTRASRRCLDLLRGQADRVIRLQEEHGLVRLHDEAENTGTQWEFPRTVLDLS